MPTYKNLKVLILLFWVIATIPTSGFADVPVVDNVMVTDVTTVSFSVIWSSSEASTADIDVFQDSDGVNPVPDAVVVPHPVNDSIMAPIISEAAENIGVMKVMVTGLQPDTSYYFRTVTTSKSTSDVTYSPASGPFTFVTTELNTMTYMDGLNATPFGNDVIIEPCYLDNGITPADGSLLVATVSGGKNPITAFVGDGVISPYALIDLNNIYKRETSGNLNLYGGENLNLLNFRGINGNSMIIHKVPEDSTLMEINYADFGLQEGRNMVSFQLEPNDTDILEILSPIMDNVVSAWVFDTEESEWLYFVRDGLPFLNNLASLSAYNGFYLYLDNMDSLRINGVLGKSNISLKAGRNLIGSRSIETLPVSEAFNNIYDELISVWYFDDEISQWRFFEKTGEPVQNTLDQIEPGKAYWVYVQNDCSL